jgi:hypothetical protein
MPSAVDGETEMGLRPPPDDDPRPIIASPRGAPLLGQPTATSVASNALSPRWGFALRSIVEPGARAPGTVLSSLRDCSSSRGAALDRCRAACAGESLRLWSSQKTSLRGAMDSSARSLALYFTGIGSVLRCWRLDGKSSPMKAATRIALSFSELGTSNSILISPLPVTDNTSR